MKPSETRPRFRRSSSSHLVWALEGRFPHSKRTYTTNTIPEVSIRHLGDLVNHGGFNGQGYFELLKIGTATTVPGPSSAMSLTPRITSSSFKLRCLMVQSRTRASSSFKSAYPDSSLLTVCKLRGRGHIIQFDVYRPFMVLGRRLQSS